MIAMTINFLDTRRLGLPVGAIFDGVGERVAAIAERCGIAVAVDGVRRRLTESGIGGQTPERDPREVPLITVLKLAVVCGDTEARELLAKLRVAPDGLYRPRRKDATVRGIIDDAWQAGGGKSAVETIDHLLPRLEEIPGRCAAACVRNSFSSQ